MLLLFLLLLLRLLLLLLLMLLLMMVMFLFLLLVLLGVHLPQWLTVIIYGSNSDQSFRVRSQYEGREDMAWSTDPAWRPGKSRHADTVTQPAVEKRTGSWPANWSPERSSENRPGACA